MLSDSKYDRDWIKAESKTYLVKIDDDRIEIGVKDIICVLSIDEWEVLKQKILNREI